MRSRLSHPPVRIKTQWGRLEHSAFLDSTPMVSLVPEIPMDTRWTRNFRLVRGKYHALCTLIMYLNLTCSAQKIYLHIYIYIYPRPSFGTEKCAQSKIWYAKNANEHKKNITIKSSTFFFGTWFFICYLICSFGIVLVLKALCETCWVYNSYAFARSH